MAWGARSGTFHPREWHRTRARVLRRDGGVCQWPNELRPGVCGSADRVQVDRRVPFSQGGSSTEENSWCLCHYHHVRKTAQEAAAARKAAPPKPDLRLRPAPQHPSRRRA